MAGPTPWLLVCACPLLLAACDSDRRASGAGAAAATLLAIEYGALVDVYGLRRTPDGTSVRALYARDVLIGTGIPDQRNGSGRDLPDDRILYDFLPAVTDDLQPRLLITRELGSREFDVAFAALEQRVRRIEPGRFGQDTTVMPFSVVPRDCALRLTFSRDLGIDASFFYTLEDGAITGVRNAEAVQVLRIVGDPNDGDASGDFEVIPARISTAGSQLLIDPVLSLSEGVRLHARAQPTGLPESADQVAANVRLALAVEGPLAIPSLAGGPANGVDGGSRRSLVHDFRAGNRRDDSAELARGFRRDPVAPRLVGEVLMYLERVEAIDDSTQRLTLCKGGARQRVDAGDVVRVVSADGTAAPIALTEAVAHPDEDPDADHVEVLVRHHPALAAADPSRLPGYPSDRTARAPWLVAHAPRAVLAAECEAGDDPRHFVRFTPTPLALGGAPTLPNRDVSPFAAALVRFSKPIDPSSARALETFFFATQPLAGAAGEAAVSAYLHESGMDPAAFERAKFATPHLVAAQVFDENGAQTTLRLQPPLGFYLDATLREPRNERQRTYYVHVIGGRDGLRDLAGNPLEVTGEPAGDALVLDFTLDVRTDELGRPLFADNRVANVARRFWAADEDENPSYHRRDEVRAAGSAPNERTLPIDDLFGAVHHVGSRLHARPTARMTSVADDLNQTGPPPQSSDQRWCPEVSAGEAQIAFGSATMRFGQPLQNPLNPHGCRLMTVWREIDLGLSRTDPSEFNLDVEAMYWAPHSAWPIVFDEFDRMSLFLGHSEYRAENCEGVLSGVNATFNSGLSTTFADNFLIDRNADGRPEPAGPRNPPPHVGFRDVPLVVDPSLAVTERNGVNQYLPLPALERPCFVWRDETVVAQGGAAGFSSDVASAQRVWEPYIPSPFLAGGGRFYTRDAGGAVRANWGRWINADNFGLQNPWVRDALTGGLVGAIALPLLADFQMYPDAEDLPVGRGYMASGRTGWQIALAVESSSIPNFRVYSGGGVASGQAYTVTPESEAWSRASGGINPVNGQRTAAADNSFFWVRCDFLKRQSVATAGFIDLLDPHRVDADFPGRDPRLGPYYPAGAGDVFPRGVAPVYHTLFEPPLHTLARGTEVIAQYRGAGIVDPRPWIATDARFQFWQDANQVAPDHVNFPLDPRKAGDAGIRKFSDRLDSGNRPRDFWVHHYNVHVTDYVEDLDALTDPLFLARFAAPGETFTPSDVRYCNWRFIMRNAEETAEAPALESFALVYRLSR